MLQRQEAFIQDPTVRRFLHSGHSLRDQKQRPSPNSPSNYPVLPQSGSIERFVGARTTFATQMYSEYEPSVAYIKPPITAQQQHQVQYVSSSRDAQPPSHRTTECLQSSQTAESSHSMSISRYVSSDTPKTPQPQLQHQEDPAVYVNAKQFQRILKRRAARKDRQQGLECTPRTRRQYIHESRHNHAKRRPRGPGGKFLTREELERLTTPSPKTTDTIEAGKPQNASRQRRMRLGEPSTLNEGMTTSFYGAEELEDLHQRFSIKRY